MGRGRRQRGSAHPSAIVVIDKPAGMTSFSVVKRVREALGVRKAGHTGTLDPLATGVLPICLNEATKIAELLLAEDKRYRAVARLGLRTDTYDISGEVLEEGDPSSVDEARVEGALEAFRGTIQQRPPAFSAIHHQGRRCHELAREGTLVELPSREVTFHSLILEHLEGDRVTLSMHCSKGTYVRSLVDDLGRALGCGATLESLRREASGSFDLSSAVTLDQLAEAHEEQALPLVSLDEALPHLCPADLKDLMALRDLTQGKRVAAKLPADCAGPLRLRFEGNVVGIGELAGDMAAPRRVFLSVAERLLDSHSDR